MARCISSRLFERLQSLQVALDTLASSAPLRADGVEKSGLLAP